MLLAAEQAAFELRQSEAGRRVSEVESARAATASIADADGRKQHQRLVDASVRQMAELVRVVEEDPARLEQRLAGVAGRFVQETKKVTADARRRRRQQHALAFGSAALIDGSALGLRALACALACATGGRFSLASLAAAPGTKRGTEPSIREGLCVDNNVTMNVTRTAIWNWKVR